MGAAMRGIRGELSEWRAVQGWRLETVTFDWLHNIYLGVGRDLVASGIWLFIRQGMYDHFNLVDDLDDLLGSIHMDIVAKCKQYGYFGRLMYLNFELVVSTIWEILQLFRKFKTP